MRKKRERWKRINAGQFEDAKEFLKKHERTCVSACSRFSRIANGRNGHVWHLKNDRDEITALLIHNRHSMYPVFGKRSEIPGPRFLNRFLGRVYIHAIQGLSEDVKILENLMEMQSYNARERIEYDLMSLDEMPKMDGLKNFSENLIIRPPRPDEWDELFLLQAAYEKEEVIPKNGIFDPGYSRNNLNRILSGEQLMVAELNGSLVGKINTSLSSFSRFQIGGVYVRPDCRGRGIASRMTSIFAANLISQGRGISLFVKKRNIPAKAVYKRLGFKILGDYQINYY